MIVRRTARSMGVALCYGVLACGACARSRYRYANERRGGSQRRGEPAQTNSQVHPPSGRGVARRCELDLRMRAGAEHTLDAPARLRYELVVVPGRHHAHRRLAPPRHPLRRAGERAVNYLTEAALRVLRWPGGGVHASSAIGHKFLPIPPGRRLIETSEPSGGLSAGPLAMAMAALMGAAMAGRRRPARRQAHYRRSEGPSGGPGRPGGKAQRRG
jgi:hypothetical protein